MIIQKMKIVGIEIFQKYHQSCTIALKGTKMIRITRSIDLACLCFCLATRYCNSVFYTVLLQYILEDCIKNKKHEVILKFDSAMNIHMNLIIGDATELEFCELSRAEPSWIFPS